jgi:hypothetical protein
VQRRGADPPRVSRQRSVESPEAFRALAPSADMGSADADDHGEACRAVKAETLEHIVDCIIDKLTVEHWSIPELKAVLASS